MEPQIKDRYSDTILQEAMRRYAIGAGAIRPLDAVENFVYEFERDGRRYILRLAHSLRRTEALIAGEVDWVNYLAANGVAVSPAIRSQHGRFVEQLEDGQGGHFLATAFIKAEGQPPWELWTPALYADFGRLLGRMHALAVDYEPAQPAWRRPQWDDEMMDFVARYLPASESVARQKYEALCNYARTLPTHNGCYGLVHFDANGSNLRVAENGRLTIFDFDECAYTWFANDIAIALFALALGTPDPPAFTAEFMPHFLRGYQRAYILERPWLREIPVFLKMVEIFLYAVIHRDFDVHNITDEWCARFMNGRKARIEHDVPCIDFDFDSLAVYL